MWSWTHSIRMLTRWRFEGGIPLRTDKTVRQERMTSEQVLYASWQWYHKGLYWILNISYQKQRMSNRKISYNILFIKIDERSKQETQHKESDKFFHKYVRSSSKNRMAAFVAVVNSRCRRLEKRSSWNTVSKRSYAIDQNMIVGMDKPAHRRLKQNDMLLMMILPACVA